MNRHVNGGMKRFLNRVHSMRVLGKRIGRMGLRLIRDEFTELPVSRQRKHQMRRERDRECTECGGPVAAGKTLCQVHIERTKIHAAVGRAIKSGKLKRGLCWCGEIGEGHHEDYSKPLDVIWLCRLHHRQHHLKIIENNFCNDN